MLLVEAKALGEANLESHIGLDILQEGDHCLEYMDDHILTDDYRWYCTPAFSTDILGGGTKLDYRIWVWIDETTGDKGLIYVDKFMVIRLNDGGGAPTSALPGQLSDPLDPDTDRDGRKDGEEVVNNGDKLSEVS